MNKYYTYFPICPYCLEPAKGNYPLVSDDNPEIFVCSKCGNRFRNFIELDSNFKFPLFSEICLNPLEESYVEWILKEDYDGKYFITWPWESVKFIPILLSEYMHKNENDKVFVFYHSRKDANQNNELNYELSLESVFINNNDFVNFPSLKLKKNSIFERNMQGYCKIYVNSLDNQNIRKFNEIISSWEGLSPIFNILEDYYGIQFHCGYVDDEKTCFYEFYDKFKLYFGKDSIKQIDCCGNMHEFNKKGIFELVFYESYSYDPKLTIDEHIEKSFYECYNNKFELVSPFMGINYCFINSISQLDDFTVFKDYSIFFIDLHMSLKMLEFIEYINPNLIISTDIDSLFGKKRYNPHLVKLFSSEYNMLLFSVNLNRRSFYKIGSSDNFLKKKDFTFHTFDNSEILNQLITENSLKISLFSSNADNIHGKKSSLKINLESCNELEKVDNCLEVFDEIFSNDYDIHKYICDLIKTPVFIGGDYRTSFYRPNVNLEYLLDIVFNSDEESWKILNSVFQEIYGTGGNFRNPLLNRIVELINDFEGNNDEIVVIVNHYDIRKLRLILNEIFGEDCILITKWNDLNEDIKSSNVVYGIATEFPTLTYDLYNSPLNQVSIIGSPDTIEKFEGYKNSRFTHNGIKPICLLSDDEKAPVILKNVFDNLELNFDDIDEFNNELNIIIDENEFQEDMSTYKKYSEIKKGTNVILAFNYVGQAMVIPFDREIGILNNGIDMINISSKKSNHDYLVNSNIIINNPLNVDFFKFVIEYGQDIVLKYNNHIWHGFKELIESMFEWVEIFQKIINKECNETSKDINTIKKELVEKIKQTGVNAQTAAYIKSNWLSDPYILETTCGEVNIYNSERPWDAEDIYKLYSWISKDYPDLSIPSFEAYKTYDAAIKLQDIRLTFLKNKDILFDKELKQLNNLFQEYVVDKFDKSDLFNVDSYSITKVKRDVKPYKILEDYTDYFDI